MAPPSSCAGGSARGSRAGTAAARHLDAGARELDRRQEELGPGHPAEPAVCLQAPQRARAPRPTLRRRGTPASTRRRSRSPPRPSLPCRREGTAKKQSSSVGSPPASRRSRKPPPAGPVSGPSATNAAKAAATTASTAFPPARAPTRPPRRCAGSRLRPRHACRERRASTCVARRGHPSEARGRGGHVSRGVRLRWNSDDECGWWPRGCVSARILRDRRRDRVRHVAGDSAQAQAADCRSLECGLDADITCRCVIS